MQSKAKAVTLVALGLGLALPVLFSAWFLALPSQGPAPMGAGGSMAQAYTQALVAGHAYLPGSGPRPIDTSLFQGRFYLYFGIVPFAVVSVPWAILTHTLLPDATVEFIFLLAGYGLYGAALALAHRRLAAPASPLRMAGAALLLVLCGGTAALLGRPAIYEIEVAAAYAFSGAAVLCLLASIQFPRRRLASLSAAGLFLGLTVGCRPGYAAAVVVLGSWAGFQGWKSGRTWVGRLGHVALVMGPLLAVALLVAGWNYFRFGNPGEFGLTYTGFTDAHPHLSKLSVKDLLYGVYRYLLGPFRLGLYFPFIEGPSDGMVPRPASHEGMDQVYGCLLIFPALLWSSAALWRERRPAFPDRLLPTLVVAALANLLFLAFLIVGTYRYPVDFLGILSFVAAVGVLRSAAPTPGLRRLVERPLLALAGAWSVGFGLFQCVAIARTSGLFDEHRPGDFAALARPFNRVAYAIERRAGLGPAELELDLRLPANRFGQVDPLLVCGDNGLQDFLYIIYVAPGLVQLGFESEGHGGPVSREMAVDYRQSHRVRISYGSFLPPADHPIFDGLTSTERALAQHFIHVTLDGEAALDSVADLHAVRGEVYVGASPDNSAFGSQFGGTIEAIRRRPVGPAQLYPAWRPDMFGPVGTTVELVRLPPGTLEPLLAVGYRPRGGTIVIEHLTGSEVRVGWQAFDQATRFGAAFAWDFTAPHRLEISLGSLYPSAGSPLWDPHSDARKVQRDKRRVRCSVDGQPVLVADRATPEVSPLSVALGQNTLMVSGLADRLAGRIISTHRAAWNPPP